MRFQLIRPWLSCVREVVAAEVRWLDRKSASTIKQFLGGDGVSFGERDEMGEAERAGVCVGGRCSVHGSRSKPIQTLTYT